MEYLNKKISNCPDIVIKKIIINNFCEGYFIYVKGFANIDILQRDFIKPILSMNVEEIKREDVINKLPLSETYNKFDLESVIKDIFEGYVIFILDGCNKAISCNINIVEKRAIEEPVVEKNVKGSHEGFLEVLETNRNILRRKIKNDKLKFKELKVGNDTNQTVVIAYIEGIANMDLIDNLYDEIEAVNIDGLISIGYLEQLMKNNQWSIFPLYLATERPDRAMAALLQGQLVLMLDGTPVVLIAPVDFFTFFKAVDDYSENWVFGTFTRVIRILAAFIAMFLPAIYIMITSFHYYIIPLNLLIPLAETRAKVPFSPIVEAILMELTIEMIRESSIRLPTYISASVGTVAGIVVGQTAIEAKLVSSLFVIVVAVTALSSFIIPSNDMSIALRLLRFIVMIFAASFGICGVIIFTSFVFIHLIMIESLGQPYFQPLIPLKLQDLRDSIVRFPMELLNKRPNIAKPLDKIRGKKNE